MKILVYGQNLEIGGCQVNAIELAVALRDIHGYQIVYFASPGPMVELVHKNGLRFVQAPDPLLYPSPARMRALRNTVEREKPDLVHVWDWWQCLDAFYAVYLPLRVPLLVSHMMMDLTRVLPKGLPTTYGTPELRDQARERGRSRSEVLLPPVDVHLNAPNAVDPRTFRDLYGINDDDITLVTVSRLHTLLKSESLVRTIDAIRRLGRDLPLRFVIVGEGDFSSELQRLADETNAELRRPAVILTGPLVDPRPAYAAADIVIGMGGSALRGMAFGKPVLIVGERGFSAPLTPNTAETFYYKGIYGRGDGDAGNDRMVRNIRELAEHPERLPALGEFSREFVVRHFSLEERSYQLAGYCRDALSGVLPVHTAAAEGLRSAAIALCEGKVVPYWLLRATYHRFGGPPVFPFAKKMYRNLVGSSENRPQ